MVRYGLAWKTDIPVHASLRALIMLNEQLKSEAYINECSKIEKGSKEHALEMKRMFVRYVSHEIRTPLNTVAIGVKLIQSLRSAGIGMASLASKSEGDGSSAVEPGKAREIEDALTCL